MGFSVVDRALLLLEGTDAAVSSALAAIKVGTARAPNLPGGLGLTRRIQVHDPIGALVAVHGHGIEGSDPLANPWSSHRDLMGFRVASFYDAAVWDGRIDPRLVHIRAGGRAMPRDATASLELPRRDLHTCLRVSAAVLGVLPGSRCSMRLFAQLSRRAGQRQIDIASAALLTPRRIRQLEREPEPLLPVALRSLGDQRLRRVP